MKIDKKLMLIKAHFFFFFGAMGPILPQMSVYGKKMGISSVVIGIMTGILSPLFVLVKPLFGLLIDKFRKNILSLSILIMAVFFAGLYFIPIKPPTKLEYLYFNHNILQLCNFTNEEIGCRTQIISLFCNSECLEDSFQMNYISPGTNKSKYYHELCLQENNFTWKYESCALICKENLEAKEKCLYRSFNFWGFVFFIFVGSITFNVVTSISDSICFDVIGRKDHYGQQRVWGTVGYGATALISGYTLSLISKPETVNYNPAFLIMIICSVIDTVICTQLKLPMKESPRNIFKNVQILTKNSSGTTFFLFVIFVGVLHCITIFFLLWYMEDLAIATNTNNVKLIEGLTIAAETFSGEIFFSVTEKILKRFGHVYSFSSAIFFYGLRLGLISLVTSPWWIVPVEFLMHGPTYALAYSTIAAYTGHLIPPKTSATIQGIATGMDNGIGLALGSLSVGLLFKLVGAKYTLSIFSFFAIFSSFFYILLFRTILSPETLESIKEYNPPDEPINAREAAI